MPVLIFSESKLTEMSGAGVSECAWTQSLQAAPNNSSQLYANTSPSFVLTEMASHHSVGEGKAVSMEPIEVELEEGTIKT